MIADTFNQETGPNEEAIKQAMMTAIEKSMIDPSRVYVSGFSLGCIPVSEFQQSYPVEIVTPTIEDFEEICDENDNPNYPLGEFDSTKWAPEFKKIGIKLGYLTDDISDAPGDWLHTWFCAAIMTGYDYAVQQYHQDFSEEDERELRMLAEKELDDWENELVENEYSFWGV